MTTKAGYTYLGRIKEKLRIEDNSDLDHRAALWSMAQGWLA